MSADNYLLIRKEDSNWVAYMELASMEEPSYRSKIFVTDTLVDVILQAQEIDTEYGYKFEIEGLYNNDTSLD